MINSAIKKRSIVVGKHKTAVSLEDPFWEGLKEIAVLQHQTLSELVGNINAVRKHGNLSSAIRMFVLKHYRP
jgi:predicted DNA-binding ribbon-helix-helix protein